MAEAAEAGCGTDPALLVAWYGDDFTGAAAVLEVLTFAGLPALLFLDVPTAEQIARHPGLRAVGVASTARSQSPDWMDATLPAALSGLAALAPGLLHYKICSTLDSSPETGSIGRAIEIGARSTGAGVVPVLVAAPKMRRYQCFGHLFAGTGDDVVRLDRHPVMSRHPVTPMTEADVARHICAQSGVIDGRYLGFPALAEGTARLPGRGRAGRVIVVTLDATGEATDAAAGRLMWEARATCPFVVGSQGVEFALVAHWQRTGAIAPVPPPGGIGRAGAMMTVSGSVSVTTQGQIAWARDNGFACIPFEAARAAGTGAEVEAEVERTVAASLQALSEGRDPLVHSADGPDDPRIGRFLAAAAARGLTVAEANRRVGDALGRVLRRLLDRAPVRRAVVSGGDTSGHATRHLGFWALSALAPTIPGAAICRAHADGPMDGLELALKGGQMGSPDYFGWVRDGGGSRSGHG